MQIIALSELCSESPISLDEQRLAFLQSHQNDKQSYLQLRPYKVHSFASSQAMPKKVGLFLKRPKHPWAGGLTRQVKATKKFFLEINCFVLQEAKQNGTITHVSWFKLNDKIYPGLFLRGPNRVPRISNRVLRIRENRVPKVREIGSLQVHTGYPIFSLNNPAYIVKFLAFACWLDLPLQDRFRLKCSVSRNKFINISNQRAMPKDFTGVDS